MKLTTLESNVLRMLLAGDGPELATLRAQASAAEVASRKLSGVGFYTEFEYPSEQVPLPGAPTFDFGDVAAESPQIAHGAGFMLFVRDGKLHALEGYTYDDPWPNDETKISLSYEGGARDPNAFMDLIRGASATKNQ